ncbi:uncharacterized protein LOC108040747 [Drosophila rhopaloa]|uniref:Uncharacterized protein LOC108040747 n=1 Tax=Drosophila rhopaloa TaxID=1041015 RepID=A0A6P4E706_DRORH|nr:uncharacterized protein LOC108040747 [Drosophila rhopaloa]
MQMVRLSRCSRLRRRRDEEGDPDPLNTIDPYELREFILTVYINASILGFISALPLLIISSLMLSVVTILPVPPYFWMVLAFGVLSILTCLPVRRVRRPILWVMAIGDVELIALAGAYFVSVLEISQMMVFSLMAGLVLIPLLICGAKCRKSCLPNVLVTVVIVCLCLAALFPLWILTLVTDQVYYLVGFTVALFILAVVLVPLQVQFIHGRMHYVPLDYDLICSLCIVIDGWILFFCITVFCCTFAQKISGSPNYLEGLSTVPK